MIGTMRRPSKLITATLLFAAVVLGGCQSAPTRGPAAPSLQLIGSAPLVLADDCRVSGTVIVEFTVLESGRVDTIRAGSDEPCVRQALTAWVESFRYSPPGRATPASIEWMVVTARRGP